MSAADCAHRRELHRAHGDAAHERASDRATRGTLRCKLAASPSRSALALSSCGTHCIDGTSHNDAPVLDGPVAHDPAAHPVPNGRFGGTLKAPPGGSVLDRR
jgi:hypothetical protein